MNDKFKDIIIGATKEPKREKESMKSTLDLSNVVLDNFGQKQKEEEKLAKLLMSKLIKNSMIFLIPTSLD